MCLVDSILWKSLDYTVISNMRHACKENAQNLVLSQVFVGS